MTTEERDALRSLRVCHNCADEHFRAYPDNPDLICQIYDCQCWCRE